MRGFHICSLCRYKDIKKLCEIIILPPVPAGIVISCLDFLLGFNDVETSNQHIWGQS